MSTYTTTQTDPKTEQQRTELSELRRKLFSRYEYVAEEDPELYHQIGAFLQRSSDVPDGNVGSAVKSRLRDLKKSHKMRDHRDIDDGEDAFPDECKECQHYGVACPIIKRYGVKQKLKRIIRTAETDEELIERLSDLAIEHGCHVVLDELEAYEDAYGDYLQEGYRLDTESWKLLNDALDDASGPEQGADGPVTTTFNDAPPDDVQDEIDATVDAVMTDDEEDDS